MRKGGVQHITVQKNRLHPGENNLRIRIGKKKLRLKGNDTIRGKVKRAACNLNAHRCPRVGKHWLKGKDRFERRGKNDIKGPKG